MFRGSITFGRYSLPLALAALVAWSAVDVWAAGSHHRIHCGPDGSCPPNAYHFGFYQTQWRTWPTPPRAEDQRRPEAVKLPIVQPPGVAEEDLDVPPQPKAAPKGETLPPTGDDPLKTLPKTDIESKQPPPVPGIEDILRPPTETHPSETPPKTELPTRPNPFGDERANKDKELGDILEDLEGRKKPSANLDKVPPPRPQPKPGDLPIPGDTKQMDDPLKDLPKFEGTKTSASSDLSALDLSPRPRAPRTPTTIHSAATNQSAVVRASVVTEAPQRSRDVKQADAISASRGVDADRTDNPLRSEWSPRRGPSPLRPIPGVSAEGGEGSWSARKNPLREK